MRMAVFISHSAEETFEFAKRYAVTLHGGDVVLAKRCLPRALLRAWA